jgi:hypothetical protein
MRIQDRIGLRLRLVFEDTTREPLPNRFHDLLLALDEARAGPLAASQGSQQQEPAQQGGHEGEQGHARRPKPNEPGEAGCKAGLLVAPAHQW